VSIILVTTGLDLCLVCFYNDYEAVMSLRIGTNVSSLAIQSAIHKSEKEQLRASKNISTGSRLADPSADSAGLAQSENLRSDMSGLQAAQRNAQQATSFAAVAEGSLAEQANLVVRLRELAVQAASDTYTDQERSYMQTEFSNLQAEIDRIALATSFGSQKLLNGSAKTIDIQVGHSGDKNSRITFNAEADSTLSGLDLSSSRVSDKSDALEAIESADAAMEKLSIIRASYGSFQSRLDSADNQLGATVEALTAARSQINDADVAAEVSQLRKQQILQQYQSTLLQQSNEQVGTVLRLIG